MSQNVIINKIADVIICSLKNAGLTVHRYDAYSTSSIYLKLDYGVANSIRISTHAGKEHLKYRYNIILGYSGDEKIIKDECPMYFYNENSIYELIDKILVERQNKIDRYGLNNYDKYMTINRNNREGAKGFWKQAKLV